MSPTLNSSKRIPLHFSEFILVPHPSSRSELHEVPSMQSPPHNILDHPSSQLVSTICFSMTEQGYSHGCNCYRAERYPKAVYEDKAASLNVRNPSSLFKSASRSAPFGNSDSTT